MKRVARSIIKRGSRLFNLETHPFYGLQFLIRKIHNETTRGQDSDA